MNRLKNLFINHLRSLRAIESEYKQLYTDYSIILNNTLNKL